MNDINITVGPKNYKLDEFWNNLIAKYSSLNSVAAHQSIKEEIKIFFDGLIARDLIDERVASNIVYFLQKRLTIETTGVF